MATTKPAAKSTAAKKPAAPKKATTPKAVKKVAEKKPTTKKAAPKKSAVSPFERYKMIEVAAYYIAEKDGFVGYAADYWITAEKEIDKKLSKK